MNIKDIVILLVEDNLGDIRLTQEALKEGDISSHLLVARDGVEAMQMLNHENPYQDYPVPDLILLDLNLPRKDGREVLKEIKSNTLLRSIPVIVLTTSTAIEDIRYMYDLHANCYITKPVDYEQFSHVVRSIKEFWLNIVRLPRSA